MASGKANQNSDVDLMAIGDVDFADLAAALYPLQQTLAREINPKVYSESEWLDVVDQGGAFVREILDKPRLFVIGDESTLSAIGSPALRQ